MHLADSRPEPSCRIGTSANAEQRRVDRQRRALADILHGYVRAIDHAQVRLVGVALLDELLGRKVARRRVGLGVRQRRKAREALVQLLLVRQMVEIARQEDPTARASPAALAERDDPLAREAAQVLLGTEHRASQWVLAEGRLVDQVLRDRRRLVVGAVDLLDNHAPLTVELLRVDPRAPDEIAQQVDRLRRGLGADGQVKGDQVVARVRVQHPPEPLGGLVDILVRRVLLPALEHEVLEEVGHPVLL
jgi:hypothetical protein